MTSIATRVNEQLDKWRAIRMDGSGARVWRDRLALLALGVLLFLTGTRLGLFKIYAAAAVLLVFDQLGWLRVPLRLNPDRDTLSRRVVAAVLIVVAALALGFSPRAVVMNKGRIVYDGASASLQADAALLETYLGVTETGTGKPPIVPGAEVGR